MILNFVQNAFYSLNLLHNAWLQTLRFLSIVHTKDLRRNKTVFERGRGKLHRLFHTLKFERFIFFNFKYIWGKTYSNNSTEWCDPLFPADFLLFTVCQMQNDESVLLHVCLHCGILKCCHCDFKSIVLGLHVYQWDEQHSMPHLLKLIQSYSITLIIAFQGWPWKYIL